jgi:hypothetical protein
MTARPVRRALESHRALCETLFCSLPQSRMKTTDEQLTPAEPAGWAPLQAKVARRRVLFALSRLERAPEGRLTRKMTGTV